MCNDYYKCPHTDIISFTRIFGNIYFDFFSNATMHLNEVNKIVNNMDIIILEDKSTYNILQYLKIGPMKHVNAHAHSNSNICDEKCTAKLNDILSYDIYIYNKLKRKENIIDFQTPLPRLPSPSLSPLPATLTSSPPSVPSSSLLISPSPSPLPPFPPAPFPSSSLLISPSSSPPMSLPSSPLLISPAPTIFLPLYPPDNPPSFPSLLFSVSSLYWTILFTIIAVIIWCGSIPHIIYRQDKYVISFNVACSTIASFSFLVFIAISKITLTKYIFEHIHAPVAMSALSCLVTALLLFPIVAYNGNLKLLHRNQIPMFSAVCIAITADLAFTNIGLSILPLAFQQSIKATLPTVTVILEILINKKKIPASVIAIVIGICIGPIIMSLDKSWDSDDRLLYGVLALTFSIVAGGFKYVLVHDAIKQYKEDIGILGFTVWMEIFAMIFLVPWSIINGELRQVIVSYSDWLLLVGTAAFGGVRILSQFLFLDKTSATSLAASNIVIQVGLTVAGTLIFDDPVTIELITGSCITIVMSASYLYVKSIKTPQYLHVKEGDLKEVEMEGI